MKFGQKTKGGNGAAILWGVVAVLATLFGGGWIAAAMLHSGQIPEKSVTIATIIIRSVATIAGVAVTCLLSTQTLLRNAVITVSVSFVILVALAMLLWKIDLTAVLIGIAISGAVTVVCGCTLSKRKSGRLGGIKKTNIVKMYKK